ncbi:LamG-like jellyroll fold domain-containing protein [Amnibacterium sp.]|uniref:LamG-like jellyroll fold domain-containing protein n=1 Tax=Amnibacterium sp. TaxID=1872496 RepID=UPI0026140F89|nr:LamG-like jellyroll fold domain-containing protein [Amnibacterium sp.]MCU1475241.1 LamG protein [Amnibacterium sp.]
MRRIALGLAAAASALGMTLAAAAPASAASTQVALWNMGDTGSTMADASGHGHTGTLHNVSTGQPGTSSGKAFGFFSHPSYVSVPSSSELNPGTSSFSFTLHVKFSAKPSGDYDVLRKGLSTTDGGSYKVEILAGGNAFCDFRGSSAQGSASSSGSLADNAWHTITCARTSSSVKVTVDGKTSSKSVSTGSISNSGSLYIGAKSSSGDDQYRGLVDRVSVNRG